MIAGAAVAASLTMAGGVASAATSAWQGEAPLKNAGWQVVSVDKDALVMFEGDGVERHGVEARLWVALLFSKPQDSNGGAYSVMLVRNSFDCQAKTWRPITLQTLDASGAVLDTVDASSKGPVAAEGTNATLLEKACTPTAAKPDDKMDDLLAAQMAYLALIKDGKIK
jgi:hypothetical protein